MDTEMMDQIRWSGREGVFSSSDWNGTVHLKQNSLLFLWRISGAQGQDKRRVSLEFFRIIPEWLSLSCVPARTVSSPLIPANRLRIHAWGDQCISQYTYAIYCDLWTFDIYIYIIYIYIHTYTHIYRVSQEEWTKLRESVPYVKIYRYNPKHLYPKLNGYGDNGQRSLKLLRLLHTYWLPNSY